jgi:hypothetical protein
MVAYLKANSPNPFDSSLSRTECGILDGLEPNGCGF